MHKRQFTIAVGLLLVAFFLAMPGSVTAQSLGTGTIQGRVIDQSGAVIPGAQVKIRNTGTNLERSLTSDEGGNYRAVLLPPGRYEVTASSSGFATIQRPEIVVEVGSVATVNFEMQVVAAEEVVTVTDTAPVTEPERTEVTSLVDQKSVESLPINGRRWENFVLLTPGVAPDGDFGLVSYRGVSGLYNNNTVDGADNNQAFFSEARGRTRAVYTISQSSIKEFQVGLSNFSAEIGRAAGGTVNAVTKSGSNQFHGEAFYFIRDAVFNAREPFQPSKPDERRQQFGAAIGGPIVGDKLFFFASYDQQKRNFPYFVRTNSSTFLNVRTDTCTNSATDPIIPGCAATIAFFQSLSTFVPRSGDNYVAFGKIDYLINADHTLTGQYNFHKWQSPNGIRTAPIQTNAESDNGTDRVRTDFMNVRLNSILSSSVVNEFRFQFGRDFESQVPNVTFPGTSVSGGISFGMPNFLPRPAFPNEKVFQWVDNLSWIRGNHNLKVGFDLYYVRELQINLFQGGGVYSFSNLVEIAKDCPPGAMGCVVFDESQPGGLGANFTGRHGRLSQSFDLRGLNGRLFFTTTDINWYAQDTWRMLPNLTFQYGVRYEYTRLPDVPVTTTTNPSTGMTITAKGNPAFPATQGFNADTNNFGPRLGLSWDVFNNQKLVWRAGYGMTYGRTSNSFLSTALTDNQLVFIGFGFSQGDPIVPQYPGILSAPPAISFAAPDVLQLAPDFVRPLVHMTEMSLEYGLTDTMSISATYVWSRGLRLPSAVDINMDPPNEQVTYIDTSTGDTFGPFPFYTGSRPRSDVRRLVETQSVVGTQYHAGIFKFTRRFSGGLAINAHFTWAKALDDGQTRQTFQSRFAQVLDGFDRSAEYGRSELDVQKQFVSYFTYVPPFDKIENTAMRRILNGFEWSGIVTLRDGRPVDQDITGSVSGSRTRATETFGPNGYGGTSRPPWLQRNSFTSPGLATFDFRTTRNFPITETMKAVFIIEAFNLFNRKNLVGVNDDIFRIANSGCRTTTGTLGNCVAGQMREVEVAPLSGFLVPFSASSTLSGPREFQISVKFLW